jgi:hypothetical protein
MNIGITFLQNICTHLPDYTTYTLKMEAVSLSETANSPTRVQDVIYTDLYTEGGGYAGPRNVGTHLPD